MAALLLAYGRSPRPLTPHAEFPTPASLRLAAPRGAGPRGLLWGVGGGARGQGDAGLGEGEAGPGKGRSLGLGGVRGGLRWGGAGQGTAWKIAGKAQGLWATACATGAQSAE